jgi:hypothetical protein
MWSPWLILALTALDAARWLQKISAAQTGLAAEFLRVEPVTTAMVVIFVGGLAERTTNQANMAYRRAVAAISRIF